LGHSCFEFSGSVRKKAYDRFHGNGPYEEILTKKEQSERLDLPQDYLAI